MKRHLLLFALLLSISLHAQVLYNERGQAMPPATQAMDKTAFANHDCLQITWLTHAGFLINDHGECLFIDPMLLPYGQSMLRPSPLRPHDVPSIQGILVTHADDDHMHMPTLNIIGRNNVTVYTTLFVDSIMKANQLRSVTHHLYQPFCIGNYEVMMVPVFHSYQYEGPGMGRVWGREDCCSFLIRTSEGKVLWHMGDTRLLPDHLELPWKPDVIMLDMGADDWHLGLHDARLIANRYLDAQLFVCHWGCVDAPESRTFNGDPEALRKIIINPDRVIVRAPGEAVTF